MPVNNTKDWIYLAPDGSIFVGAEPPSRSTVLAAPGGFVPLDVVIRYGLADRLEGKHRPDPVAESKAVRQSSVEDKATHGPDRIKAVLGRPGVGLPMGGRGSTTTLRSG